MTQGGRRVSGVHRNRYGTEAEYGEVTRGELDPIRQAQGDPVTATEARSNQPATNPSGFSPELAVGHSPPFIDHGHVICPLSDDVFGEIHPVPLRGFGGSTPRLNAIRTSL